MEVRDMWMGVTGNKRRKGLCTHFLKKPTFGNLLTYVQDRATQVTSQTLFPFTSVQATLAPSFSSSDLTLANGGKSKKTPRTRNLNLKN